MLRKIKNIFSKKEKQEESNSESSTNPNFLTDPTVINKLLKDIEETSPLCTISFEGTTEEFSSSILDVQLKNGQIILDEFVPKHGNEVLLTKKEFKLSTVFKGIHLAFKLSKIKTCESRGIAYYKAAIPDRIYYPQRRSAPRIEISTLNIPFSGVSDRTKSTVDGYIYDLSRDGIGIVTNNNRAKIQRGETINNCLITIDNFRINFDLIIRFVKTSQQGSSKILIGGYFENIPSNKLNKLDHFFTTLEREEIRKKRR